MDKGTLLSKLWKVLDREEALLESLESQTKSCRERIEVLRAAIAYMEGKKA